MDTHITIQSGGSTGEPKSITRSVHSWVMSSQIEALAFGIRSSDRFAVIGSPSHSLWAYANFRANLIKAPCLGLPVPALKDSFERLIDSSPSVVYGVPELVVSIAARLSRRTRTLDSVRLLLLGGGPWPANQNCAFIESVMPNARIWLFYGSAEASFVGFGRVNEPLQPFDQVQILIDKNQQIWVNSPMTIAPNEWINTGDLGQWCEEGRFVLTGRASRRIIRNGIKYAVEPVEQKIALIFGFSRVALVDRLNEGIICMVDLNRAHMTLPPIQALNQCIQSIPSHHQNSSGILRAPFPRISSVRVVQPWPTTPSGKTDFTVLNTLEP